MSASITPLELPKIISSKKEGYEVIAELVKAIVDMKKTSDRPCVGMLYLKFNSEPEMEEWIASFKTLMNCKGDMKFLVIGRENDRTLIDMLFADSNENLKTVAKMRFPEMEF
jgi:hypothetical protein